MFPFPFVDKTETRLPLAVTSLQDILEKDKIKQRVSKNQDVSELNEELCIEPILTLIHRFVDNKTL